MDKNLSASAGDMCSIPGPGRFHMPRSNEARVPQLLSLRSRACKPQLPKAAHPEPVLRNQRSRCDEEPWATRKRSSHSLQPEKARAKQRRPSTGKNSVTWEFSGGPVVRTQCFHCKARGSAPGPGSMIPRATWRGDKKSVL